MILFHVSTHHNGFSGTGYRIWRLRIVCIGTCIASNKVIRKAQVTPRTGGAREGHVDHRRVGNNGILEVFGGMDERMNEGISGKAVCFIKAICT
jgi:hypothetical protein